jgi:hypothetical protein
MYTVTPLLIIPPSLPPPAPHPRPSATHKKKQKINNFFKLLRKKCKRLSQESRIKSTASVAVGIAWGP